MEREQYWLKDIRCRRVPAPYQDAYLTAQSKRFIIHAMPITPTIEERFPATNKDASIRVMNLAARQFAHEVAALYEGEPCRELSLFLTHLEEGVLWAGKGLGQKAMRGGASGSAEAS